MKNAMEWRAAAAAVVLTGGMWARGASVVAPDYQALSRRIADVALECLDTIAVGAKNNGTLFYSDGVWHSPNLAASWETHVAPGSAAAGLWHSGMFDAAPEKKERLRAWAAETFDRALRDHQNPDGSFGKPGMPESLFFLVELASATLWLDAGLEEARKQAWREALEKGIAQLVESGSLYNEKTKRSWYTNGNLELEETSLLYLAWAITKEPRYRDMYERQLAFTIFPDRPRWRNFGLYYEDEPGRPDGLDGRGYLAENASGHPGYDGDYTHFQADIAAKLYLLSDDPRALRLVNLFINQLMRRTDRDTWILDATGGSRHSTVFPLTTPAYAVSAAQCDRKKMLAELDEQVGMTLDHYAKATKGGWLHPGMYRGLDGELVTLLHACQRAAAKEPKTNP